MDSVVEKTLALPRDGLSEKEPGELTLREALILKEGSSRKFVRDQLMTILLAAKASVYKSPLPENKKKKLGQELTPQQDPVAILITWAIYELSRNPDIVQRLRAEIQET